MDTPQHWAAVATAYKKDLDLVAGVIMSGEDNAHASAPVCEALDRLGLLIETLRQLDQSDEKNVATLEAVLFYIGYRAGCVSASLFTVRPSDIQLPARDILALIRGDKTLDQLTEDVRAELNIKEPS